MRVFTSEMIEGFQASLDNRRLQSGDGVAFKAGGIRQEAGYATGRRSQAGVGIHAHVQICAFSGHGC
jgi:hypothetical protein